MIGQPDAVVQQEGIKRWLPRKHESAALSGLARNSE